MAVATIGAVRSELTEYARDARLARAWALILDSMVFAVLSFVINSVYGVTQITSGSPAPDLGGFASYATSTVVPWPWLTLAGIVYFMVPEALFGATLGKYWARIRVVRVDGRPLNLGAVAIRNLLKPIDWLPILYLLGSASVLITTNSQRLGDLSAGTTVVYRHRAWEPGATRHAGLQARRIAGTLLVAAALFTVAFDYFGRPPLVIEGLFNVRQLAPGGVTSYTLGDPQWGLGTVTYSVAAATNSGLCNETVTLQWFGLGWTEGTSSFGCLV